MDLINEGAAKVIDPARLFRITGVIAWPDPAWKLPLVITTWAIPVEDDGRLLGFAHVVEDDLHPAEPLRIAGTLDYATAVRLDIQVGRPVYLDPVWYSGLDGVSLDSLLVSDRPTYEGQPPINQEEVL